jgi:hypothetical protein
MFEGILSPFERSEKANSKSKEKEEVTNEDEEAA